MAITSIQNFYESTLSASISNTDLVIPINTPPLPTEGWLCLDYDIPSKREFIYYTGRTSTSVTVPATGGRGQDSTTATSHTQNAKVRMNVNGGLLMNLAGNAATIVNQNNNGGWVGLSTTPTITSSNGQKSYSLSYAGVDYTDRLQAGTKLQVPRSIAPPTQSMAFVAASSQSASKASPSGMTFTGNFTLEAWVYLNSYSGVQGIISRDSATATGSGFELGILSTGQVSGYYRNASGNTSGTSFGNVPLKTWTHVAASFTVASQQVSIYINGTGAAGFGAPGATSLVQASTALTLGNRTSATGYLDGYISEARIWSVAQTQTQILNNMSISLVGNEANLVSLYQGNGNFNDKTANANNLTASGAVPTQASNPYNAIEYGIITSISYTGGNTVLTMFTGTDCTIPNAALGATLYSSQRAPFGFPASREKWRLSTSVSVEWIAPSNVALQVSNIGLYLPVGKWLLSAKFTLDLERTTSGAVDETQAAIGITQGAPLAGSMIDAYFSSTGSAARVMWPVAIANIPVDVSTFTGYSVLADKYVNTATKIRNNIAPGTLFAECAYL